MNVLITGGAGFIGSHIVTELNTPDNNLVVYDSLVYGHPESLPKAVKLVVADLADVPSLEKIFEEINFDAVMHFASYISMGESMENPRIYFANNVVNTLNLLDIMVKFQVKNFIFSSSAGVYGNPLKLPIPEDHQTQPTNPYGEGKLMVENILKWYDISYGLKYIALRYFNAAGASLDGHIGEAHEPETHLLPNAFKVVLGQRDCFELFGNNYPTPDGTCIRDYIHVLDLADAHIKSLKYLNSEKKSQIFNVGTGKGYSNREVLEMVKKICGQDFKIEENPRRPGDADKLYADPHKIKKILNWFPKYSDLEIIVKTAWNWHKNNPFGYPS